MLAFLSNVAVIAIDLRINLWLGGKYSLFDIFLRNINKFLRNYYFFLPFGVFICLNL